MILRHVTLRRRLPKIVRDRCLNPDASTRKDSSDYGHISFEKEPINDVLVRIFPLIKSSCLEQFCDGDQYELLFDGHKLLQDGYKVETLGQVREQLAGSVQLGILTEKELKSLGDFVHIKGKVPLDYLLEESKLRLRELGYENV